MYTNSDIAIISFICRNTFFELLVYIETQDQVGIKLACLQI